MLSRYERVYIPNIKAKEIANGRVVKDRRKRINL
jgi:hypothetical protein